MFAGNGRVGHVLLGPGHLDLDSVVKKYFHSFKHTVVLTVFKEV